jgi:hypothetical protein
MTVNPESVELTGYTGLFLLYYGMKIAEWSFQVFNLNGRVFIHGQPAFFYPD